MRESNRFNAKFVEHIVKSGREGRHPDGGGLRLQVMGRSAVWVLRTTIRGKQRDLGLGSARDVTLKEARDKAYEMRKAARAGRDPTAQRQRALTFKEAAEMVHADLLEGWSNGKHTAQWLNTLKTYAFPHVGDMDVGDVAPGDVQKVLAPIWRAKPETARRVR